MKIKTVLNHYITHFRIIPARSAEEIDYLKKLNSENCTKPEAINAGSAKDNKKSIADVIKNCDRCGSVTDRKFGVGNGRNGVMVILNAPGMIERTEKERLREESIDLLRKMLSVTGLISNECYITNLIKCECSDPLLKPSIAVDSCREILIREIDMKKPRIIIIMGEILSLQKLVRGRTDISWFNIHHPLTIIKNTELKRPAWNTLQLVMEKLNEQL